MQNQVTWAAMVLALVLVAACGSDTRGTGGQTEGDSELTPHVVELRAVGKTFEGPSEIPSGWTTFEFVNASGMIHFALIDVPPEGVTAREMSDTIMQPFQDAMDAMNAGDEAGVNAAFARFPAWIAELGRMGGPGFLSPGRVGRTTVYLEPGHYVIECYVKSDGVFHTTSPGAGQLGMIMDLTVTDARNGAPEPVADATLAVRNSGLELVDGELVPGTNTIRVDFVEQQALPSFVGNDVHLMRVDDADDIAEVNAWMDWRTANGLEDPAPAVFLGGINDLPAGSHGYFTVELVPGDYAFVAEMPDPRGSGFVLPFSVAAKP
ncbi:MAG: hypothetical protein P8172_14675 [Gammaproteobacteria bacterium]